MPDLVIVGAGGFGAETASLVEDINDAGEDWNLLGFLDDNPALMRSSVLNYEVLGGTDWLEDRKAHYVVAVGNARVRRRLVRRITSADLRPATLVHPSAAVHDSSTIGSGSIVCRGVTITVRVTIGSHCILNLHGTIGHDVVVSDYSTLHPGVHLSGGSRVGTAAELGTGVVVLPAVQVGEGSIVGAGAVAVRDVPPSVVAMGIPARTARELDAL